MEKSFEDQVTEARAQVEAISPQQANELKHTNPNSVFIDPRDMDDIRATTGIIPGALNLPLSQLNNTLDTELPGELNDYSKSIITSCQGGPMGALAAYALKKRGYKNVQYIDGGTQGWLDAGFSTTQ